VSAPQSEQLKFINVTTKKAKGNRNVKKQKTAKDAIAHRSNSDKIKGKSANSQLDIPIDVLLEIFRRLQPVDLLHLSRVSRNLHDLLTSEDVTFLWKFV
jgi:hypothetical protein